MWIDTANLTYDEEVECMGKYIEFLEHLLEVARGVRVESLREIYNDIVRQFLRNHELTNHGGIKR